MKVSQTITDHHNKREQKPHVLNTFYYYKINNFDKLIAFKFMPNIRFNLIAIAFDIKLTQCDFAYTAGEGASTRLEDTLVFCYL